MTRQKSSVHRPVEFDIGSTATLGFDSCHRPPSLLQPCLKACSSSTRFNEVLVLPFSRDNAFLFNTLSRLIVMIAIPNVNGSQILLQPYFSLVKT